MICDSFSAKGNYELVFNNINIDSSVYCSSLGSALNRFFKQNPARGAFISSIILRDILLSRQKSALEHGKSRDGLESSAARPDNH